ncbi:c-type cytochrome [Methylobacterium isbiliense]|uniref:Cytochrome c domain-containing protein n=1 Tax=Methylobacterium isbiliense TaxID=315478 RepID=A0ABQ4SFM4_9HYPH|nr:c-type cytochrome [Methylobacterium isbiliense]MDN3627927.1 c-type cytochrome [Methylobacterium isbiliense]GJE00471.1 hypothetical protein GMJLKIPL_2393 [Methylobacterium isbiliense]
MREKLEAAVLICAIQQASAQDGKAVFAHCAVCHSVEAGVNRLGPTLAGIHGRAAGAIENFVYSRTMSMSKIVWNDEALDAYLASPKKYVPGDRMPFAGIQDERERRAVIDYLCPVVP